MSQTALYSTPTATIRAIEWRFSIDPFTGRGGYQWRTLTGTWAPLETYPHRKYGLVTLAELDRAIYQPHRDTIAAAREACVRMRQSFHLTTQQMAARQTPLFH